MAGEQECKRIVSIYYLKTGFKLKERSQITLAITTYNRTGLLYESFQAALEHPLVGEILIVDDASREEVRNEIFQKLFSVPKVRLLFNTVNLGCYRNKMNAIKNASFEWVIIFDSDNILPKSYLDRIETLMQAGVNDKTIYQPTFAKPHFNFEQFGGERVNQYDVKRFAHIDSFTTALNAMNYFVHRDHYLKAWEDIPDPFTADSLLQNYNWLKSGNDIYFVPGLEYEHRIHEGSHYREHRDKEGQNELHRDLIQKLKEMR